MLNRSLAVLSAIVLLAACTPTHLTARSPTQPSRGGPCAFQILTALPSGGYVEVGVVDAHLGDYGSNTFSTLADFKKEIAPYVCRAGGDIAVAHANAAGIYVRAMVLKSTGGAPLSTSQQRGADLLTVMGMAPDEAVKEAVDGAQAEGKEVAFDLMTYLDDDFKAKRAKELVGMGATLVSCHTGWSEQAAGKTPDALIEKVCHELRGTAAQVITRSKHPSAVVQEFREAISHLPASRAANRPLGFRALTADSTISG